eukprot:TRINITY_DN19767_c0_g1_i1.p1 TRINITY_DN19767_c0_g1~~TRINITY_DN19767_c0_g1_i1.p1  ORF type:complete len:468 (-),score=59.37 TRINITY_DN19767_c0_g1_i1:123-1526(-)
MDAHVLARILRFLSDICKTRSASSFAALALGISGSWCWRRAERAACNWSAAGAAVCTLGATAYRTGTPWLGLAANSWGFACLCRASFRNQKLSYGIGWNLAVISLSFSCLGCNATDGCLASAMICMTGIYSFLDPRKRLMMSKGEEAGPEARTRQESVNRFMCQALGAIVLFALVHSGILLAAGERCHVADFLNSVRWLPLGFLLFHIARLLDDFNKWPDALKLESLRVGSMSTLLTLLLSLCWHERIWSLAYTVDLFRGSSSSCVPVPVLSWQALSWQALKLQMWLLLYAFELILYSAQAALHEWNVIGHALFLLAGTLLRAVAMHAFLGIRGPGLMNIFSTSLSVAFVGFTTSSPALAVNLQEHEVDPLLEELGESCRIFRVAYQWLRSKAVSAGPIHQSTCVVCLDAERVISCIPCGHLCLCESCAEKIVPSSEGAKPSKKAQSRARCPVCNQKASGKLRVWNC